MIKVILGGTALPRREVIVPTTISPRKILEDNSIPFQNQVVTLNGDPMAGPDLDKTLEAWEIEEQCYIFTSQKQNSAS